MEPGILFWTVSGEVILMVILGGVASLYGPAVGAALFLALFHYLGVFTDHWRLMLGIVFIAVVLFAPAGLVPLLGSAWRRRRGAAGAGAGAGDEPAALRGEPS